MNTGLLKSFYTSALMICFRCEKSEDLAMLAAQQYYVDHGTDMNPGQLAEQITQYLPQFAITGDKPADYWHQLIMQAYKKVGT